VHDPLGIREATASALKKPCAVIINVMIEPSGKNELVRVNPLSLSNFARPLGGCRMGGLKNQNCKDWTIFVQINIDDRILTPNYPQNHCLLLLVIIVFLPHEQESVESVDFAVACFATSYRELFHIPT